MARIFSRRFCSIPYEWAEAAIKIMESKGTCVILGPPDSGKTTLASFLIDSLNRKDREVALVDSDLGQSFLGPPATVSLGLFPPDEEYIEPIAMRFIGSISPVGHLLQTVVDTRKLVDKGIATGASIVLVDTSGMVYGGAAFQLKFKKIDLISPRHILILQKGMEIENLILPFEGREGVFIHRLPVSEKARIRTREERRAYREKVFWRYFRDAGQIELSIRRVFVFGNREPQYINLASQGDLSGLLVGMNNADNDTLALGIIEDCKARERKLIIKTPLKDDREVRLLHIGDTRVSL